MTIFFMGSLVNAAFWMLGLNEAELLLEDCTPTIILELWHNFVMHVNLVLLGRFVLKRFETTLAVLDIVDNSYP